MAARPSEPPLDPNRPRPQIVPVQDDQKPLQDEEQPPLIDPAFIDRVWVWRRPQKSQLPS